MSVCGQNYIPGVTYYGQDSLIEYRAGNLPIILSAPHGGYLTPSALPDRNCSGCVTGRDGYTQELTNEIRAAILFKTGCYPHVVINKLHRKKLDANREIIEATDSQSISEVYWHDYMNFIDSAKNKISSIYGKGLFLDIHGHGHTIQRIELGYLLTATELRKSDSLLNLAPLNSKSSLLNLRFSNLNNHSHSQLIRGVNSFGSLIHKKGFPTVPSDSIPFPGIGEAYFNGGYNTKRFGSFTGGTIDAIQIENNWDVRSNSTMRLRLADSISETIIDYLETHYFNDFSSFYCNYSTGMESQSKHSISVYPNPTRDEISISGVTSASQFQVISQQGLILLQGELNVNSPIHIKQIPNGIYFLKVKNKEGVFVKKIIKC